MLGSSVPARAATAARSLTELQVALYGLSGGVEPAQPIVPKQTASGVRVVVKAAGKTLSSAEVARLLGGPFGVQAELSGPGLSGTLSLPITGAGAVPSADPLILTFPGLPVAGDYELANIRLVRGGQPVLDVQPRRVPLRVIDQILVTSVVTRPLSLDEIRERGVVLDASAYLGFEFAITLRLESTPVHFRFPVVFDRQGVPVPIPLQPPPEPLRSVVSAPLLVPVLLRPVAFEGDPDGAPPDYELADLPGGGTVKIPSLLVIPGSVGYLKQFFSAQLMVGNGAPGGSGLVLKDVSGTLRMPPGADGQVGTADDPLALPDLETGPQSGVVAVLGDGGTSELLPGEFGRAEVTLRGEREGRHDVDFDIRAELLGLPVGPVTLEGSAHGVVLVRNAYFDVTFTVPTVVRADEEFSVFATVTNVGQGTGNDVQMTLDASRLSGARLLSAGTQTIATLPPGDAATLEYRFRSEVTGEVVASYLRFDTTGGVDVTGRLNFMLGVGERRVTHSPDTLILPAAVSALPSDVVRAAMRVLGQAWSAATATNLPPGVERPSTEAVFRKGLSIAEAGLRIELGQPLVDALRDLLLDLHGGGFDAGFDQVLRETTAGRDLDRILGATLASAVSSDPLGYEEATARIAASGPAFLSAAVEAVGGGAVPAELVLRDGGGRVTSGTSHEVPGALLTLLGSAPSSPRFGWLTALDSPPYAIELAGTASGVVGLSLTVPDAQGGAHHLRLEGIAVAAGSRHRLVYNPTSPNDIVLETDQAGDGVFESRQPVVLQSLASEGPRLVAAATIGPETLDGASPFGNYGALLFDRVVSEADAAALSSYEIRDNSVLAARRQLSGRLVFVAFEQPEGPLVPTSIAVTGIRDERGVGGGRQEQPLRSRLLRPGAVVSGRVLQADGQAVPDAVVTYMNSTSGHDSGRWDCRVSSESAVAAQRTDAAGRFTFRYVPQDGCGGPFRLETVDPTTGAVRGTKSYVRLDGQRLTLDLVLIGHGRVEGTVSHAGGAPAQGARVRVVSVTDSQIGVVTTTDDQGRYAVQGMTVGAVTVSAVLGANLGRGAGRLDVAGGTTTVNVTLDGNVDITGIVRKLEAGRLTPVPGVDVVYYVGGIPLGLSVTDALGQYRLLGVPAGAYRLEAGLNTRDKTSLNGNSVAGQKLVQNLVIEVLGYASYGTVKGTVRSFDGLPMPDAWVSDNVVATRTDSLGRYELAGVGLGATPRLIQAVSPDGRRSGSANALVTSAGQIVTGIDIQLSGIGAAAFQVLDSAGAPVAGASVGLQGSCYHPCGCRFSTTDTQGIARFSDLSFGPVSARAVVQGAPGAWDTAVGTATVSSEQVAAGGVIRLGGFGSVGGLVKNPGGSLAHGASVELVGRRAVVSAGVCDLQSGTLGTASTDTSGQFHFDGVHVGPVSVRASSAAFPRVVTAAGSVDAAGEAEHLELQLVDTLAGALSGTVWLPEGMVGAGPDVEVSVSGQGPDVTVHTDAQGRYAFAQVLAAGGYLLTARDTRPGGTGSVVQSRVWLQASQPAQHDLRLKAKGPVRVTVVDGSGQPVDGAVVHVTLAEGDFPYRRYEGTISSLAQQPLTFPAVFEGDFSVSVSDNFARGGRASGAVPPQGLATDITVQLTTTGSVSGHFLWPDRVTPLPFGTVRLWAGSRLIGQQTTAGEGDVGSFAFDFVPAGAVTLTAEDPRSGRTGVANGSLTAQGQQLALDVVAYAVGRVEGAVTLNAAPAPAAEVSLRSGQYSVRVNTDGAGRYAVEGVPAGTVYASADLGAGFLSGRAQGQIEQEGETLDLPIALHGAGTIDGTLVAADGQSPGAPSLITLEAWGNRQTTTTDEQGHFHFDLVPEGSVSLVADALQSFDCARESLTLAGGVTLPVTLHLRGVGAVEGTAQGSGGPVGGTLTVTGTGSGCETRQWVLSVGTSGQFRIPEIAGGPVSARFATHAPGGPWLYASDADVVTPGATTTLQLQVEPSGSVRGRVLHADQTPALGSQVRVEGVGGRVALVQAGSDGSFLAEGMPAGAITLRITDPARGGVALVTGSSVTAGALLEAGDITLLEVPLAVVSVTPAEGATGVPVLASIQIAFNAPLVPSSGISVRAGGRSLAFSSTLSADARTLTLAPGSAWPDSSEITVEAGPQLTDIYGRRLGSAYQSRFHTVDLAPPRVLAVTPADHAIQVDLGTSVLVRFDEALDTTGDLSTLVRLAMAIGPVAGTVTSPAPDQLRFTPTASLASNTSYTVTVNGAKDLLGHVQTAAFTSVFGTPDADPPILRLDAPPALGYTKQKRPTIRVSIEDALSGPDASRASLKVDGFSVTPVRSTSQFSQVPGYDLADGSHTVEASAHDRAGNLGTLVASFNVDTQPPTGAVVTAPSADTVVSGSVTLAGTASDAASGVAYLSFLRGGQWIAEGAAAGSFQAAWNTATSPDGAHLITAQPVDVAGNAGPASPGVRVIVNNQPLAVTIASPAAGFPVKNDVTVVATPSEPVARVEFRAGSGPVVVDAAAPYEVVLDISSVAEGNLTLTATAIGFAPETASATRVVLVDRTPPSTPANVRAESFGDGSILVAGAAGSVEAGARVEVENPTRQAHGERPSFADGSFALRVAGEAGDQLQVVAIDVAGNRSVPLNLAAEASEPPADAVPQTGLALWARAGREVVVDGSGRVSRWGDASASANDLVQSASGQRPTRVTDALSGRSVLHFDGTDDFLQITNRLAGSIRTVFAVLKQDVGGGGAGRVVLGDATTTDFYAAPNNWWQWIPPYVSTSQYIVNGQTWVNGTVVDGRATARPTTMSVLCIETTAGVTASRLGASFLSSSWKGDIAEVLVYERALTIAERKAVEDYLALEYLPYQATAGAPRFEPNGGTFVDSVSVTLSSPTPGAEIRYTTDGSVPTASSPLYSGPFTLSSSTTVRARAFRSAMKPSAVSAVSFDRASDFTPNQVSGLALWVRGDVGLETDSAGRLTAWRDRSGHGNDLSQAAPSLQPVVVPGAANGLASVHFDGGDDVLSFTTRLDASIRTVFAVVWEDADAEAGGPWSRSLLGDATTADFYGGWPGWWVYIPPYVSTSPYVVNGQTWINGAVVDGRATARPMALTVLCVETTAGVTASQLGKGLYSNGWKGHVAELALYDRALTPFERKGVEDYLSLKYGAPAIAGAPAFTPNGGSFEGSASVSIATPTIGGQIRYTTDGSAPTESSALYSAPLVLTTTTTVRARAFHPAMSPSSVTLATFTNSADFSPTAVADLALWVRSDIGLEKDALNRISAWRDQSGRGNHLVQATPSLQPVAAQDMANGFPAAHFDGSDDILPFTTPLQGTIRTVFAVAWEDADAEAGGPWSRSLLGDAATADFYGGAPNWWTYYIPPYVSTSSSIVNGRTWLNGASVDGRTTARPIVPVVLCVETTAGVTANQLGKGLYSNGWKGHVAELLVFDRAITPFERKSVEDYLAVRYAAYAPTVGAPAFTPNGGVFQGSVNVAVASPTPGARVYYTTDGSEPTESSTRYESPLVLSATTTVRARAFRSGLTPSAISTVTFSLASDPSPTSVPGLALWLRGDAGLELDSLSRVVGWRDQSGRTNDLAPATQAVMPVFAHNAANALPAVRFDGTDDVLTFKAKIDMVRTVFAVAWEDQDGGAVSRALLGDPDVNHFHGGSPNWWSQSASTSVLSGRTWVNGTVVNGLSTPRPIAMSVLCVEATGNVTASQLGKGMFGNGWKGHVAELVVYDRALSGVERKAVEDYLALKYQPYVATAGAPVFTPDGGPFTVSATVSIATGSPGATIRYTTDGSEPTEASSVYTQPLVLTTSTVVRARAYRPGMNPSPLSGAAFVQNSAGSPGSLSGLLLWVSSNAGVIADQTSRVQTWLDLSGRANHLQAPTAAASPLLVSGAGAALPTVHFDGSSNVLNFTRLTTIRTVFWVVREDPAATAWARFLLGDKDLWHFHGGLSRQMWSSQYADTAVRMGETRINGLPVDGTVVSRPTSLSVVSLVTTAPLQADSFSKDRTNPPSWWGDLSELVIFDRVLTAAERKAVEDYLALKHGLYVPTVTGPVFTPAGTTTLDPVTVSIASEAGAEIRYTLDESTPTQSSALYTGPLSFTTRTVVRARAFKPGFQPSIITEGRFLDLALPAPKIPTGLAVWVSADVGVTTSGGTVSAWQDQSGNGNNLVQATAALQPQYLTGAVNGLPVLRFDGSNDTLTFTTRLDATVRAVFAVLKQNGAQSWRQFMGDGTADHFNPGSTTLWSSSYASPAVLNGETWLNGQPIDGTTTNRPQTMSILSVLTTGGVTVDRLFSGKSNYPWLGDIAELIVYTQPLSSNQRKLIEDYLTLKYAPFVGTAGAPDISPNGATFTGSVEVSLTTPTPGAVVRYTTDGSVPETTSPLYASPFVLTDTTTVRARAFRDGMNPSPVSLASFSRSGDFSPKAVPGLAMWVRSDAGVLADTGGRVSAWSDQSGAGNHLVQSLAAARPIYVREAQNGLPVLRFDGANDTLAFTTRLDSTVRAVFAVLKQSGAQSWRQFMGDGTKDDFSPGSTTFWSSGYASPSVLNGETWLNGVLVNGTTTNRPQSMSVLSLLTTAGVTADRLFSGKSNYPWLGDIAELIVYTQPLTTNQRKSIEDYLTLKYAPFVGTAGAPQFSPPGGGFADSVEVSLSTPTPGAEIRYTTDLTDPTESSPLYTSPLTFTATTALQARAFRAGMNPSPVVLANFARTTDLSPAAVPGLVLWARADAGVSSDGLGRVGVWRDLSGQGNDLSQTDAALQPTVIPNAQAGLPVLRFDGANDWLAFKSRVSTIRTVFWVVREDASAPANYRFLLGDASAIDFHSGASRQLWSSYTNAAITNGETRINGALVNGLTTNRPTSLSVVSVVTTAIVTADAFSRDRTYLRTWWGDLAELIIYDRALTAAQRKTVEDQLALKYGLYVPTQSAPKITPHGSRTTAPVQVTLSADPGAEIRYTLDGTDPTPVSALYDEPFDIAVQTTVKARAYRAGFNPSPVTTARFMDTTTPAPALVPGLKLWVKADAGIVSSGGFVSTWQDQSGNGNHLVQATTANQPQFVAAQANGLPVLRFDGAGDFMSFTTRLTTIRSVFWVIKRAAAATPGYRFMLGDPTNYHFCPDSTTKIWTTSYTSSSILNGETRLNGALVNGTTTDRPTTLSVLSVVATGDVTAGTFSKDRTQDYSWWGDLAELIIFDRAVMPDERDAIESYLAAKYALYVPKAATPAIEPAGGTIAGPQLVQIGTQTPSATIRYTLDDSEPGETSPAYAGPFEVTGDARVRAKAYLAGWTPSAEAVATFYGPQAFTPASLPNLALWVRSDAGFAPDGSAWQDQSGTGNSLVQTSETLRPSPTFDPVSRMPLVRFDGAGDYLSLTARLTRIRSVFWVLRRSASMTPGYRFLLGDATTVHFYPDSSTKLLGSGYASPFVLNGQVRLNGTSVSPVNTERPANLSVLSVVTGGDVTASTFSKDRTYDYSWWGDLAELVIYERALTASEVSAVESYLAGRYSIGLQP